MFNNTTLLTCQYDKNSASETIDKLNYIVSEKKWECEIISYVRDPLKYEPKHAREYKTFAGSGKTMEEAIEDASIKLNKYVDNYLNNESKG